jgi:hypothetical protein
MSLKTTEAIRTAIVAAQKNGYHDVVCRLALLLQQLDNRSEGCCAGG